MCGAVVVPMPTCPAAKIRTRSTLLVSKRRYPFSLFTTPVSTPEANNSKPLSAVAPAVEFVNWNTAFAVELTTLSSLAGLTVPIPTLPSFLRNNVVAAVVPLPDDSCR